MMPIPAPPQTQDTTQPPQDKSTDPAAVMSDPEFLKLDGNAQRSVLSQIDPEFTKLDRLGQNSVIAHLQQKRPRPANAPTTIAGRTAESVASTAGKFIQGLGSTAKNVVQALPLATPGGAVQPRALEAGSNLVQGVTAPYRELTSNEPDEITGERRSFGERLARAGYTAIGGDPASVDQKYRSGDVAGARAEMWTTAALSAGMMALFHALLPAEETVSPTRKQIAAGQALSSAKVIGRGPVDAATRMVEIQKLAKQALAEAGITDADLASGRRGQLPTREVAPQSDVVGNITRGNDLVLGAAKDMVDIAHRPMDAVIKQYGGIYAGPGAMIDVVTPTVKALRDQADSIGKVNPQLAKAINDVAGRIEKARTFGELNDFKMHANKMVSDVYSSPVSGRAIDATAESAFAYKLAADAIRENMYPALEKASGGNLNLKALGSREADAIAFRDAVQAQYYASVAPDMARQEATNLLNYTLAGENASGQSLYSRHMVRRLIEKTGLLPGPGGMFNATFRKFTGPIGKGTQFEKVSNIPAPPSTSEVKIGPPRETLGGFQRSLEVPGYPAAHISYDIHGDTASINHFGAPNGPNYEALSKSIGTVGIRELTRKIAKDHPEVKYIQGIRIGGKRAAEARSVRMPISQLLAGAPQDKLFVVPYRAGTRTLTRKPQAAAGAAATGATSRAGFPPPPSTDEDQQQ